jgi:hypothetical protein
VFQFPRSALRVLILLAASFYLGACGPEKTVQWSADGKQAAIVSGGLLYLGDDQGNLSKPLAEEVELVTWFPDSRNLVAVFKREIDTWPELVKTAPSGFDEKKIVAAALVARDEFYNYSGKLEDFRPSNAASMTTEQWTAALLYLKQEGQPRLKEKLGAEWKEVAEMKVEVRTIRTIAASALDAGSGIVLLTTLTEIADLRVAPDGGALAFVARRGEGFGDGRVGSLSVMPARTAGRPVLVADGVAEYPDWSPDGRSLFYVRCEARGSGAAALGNISRRMVRDAQGAILEDPPQGNNLVTVLFRDSLKVRCLPDGRVVFVAAEVTLPAVKKDIADRLTLFCVNPAQPDAVSRMLPRATEQTLPDRADLFEISPDAKYASFPGGKGRVSVVTLATGATTAVIDKDTSGELHTIPVWRNAEQLCLIAPPGSRYSSSSKRAEVMLWSQGKATLISTGWPDKILDGIK